MNHPFLLASLALALAACSPAPTAPVMATNAPPPAGAKAQAIITNGVSYTLTSAQLGEDRTINVWTPASYASSNKRYATLYVIDGGLLQDYPHIAGLAQLGEVAAMFDELIVVGVETQNRIRELAHAPADARYIKEYPDSGQAAAFRSFITDEVMPFVDANYRTGDHSAVVGESLAGLFIVDTFLTAPDAFDDYISVSPSLWWDDRALARKADAILAATDLAGKRLYLTMGSEDGNMRDGLERLLGALSAHPQTGFSYLFEDRRDSETHGTIYHGAALSALRWLYAPPLVEYDGPSPWYLVDGASP